MPDSTLFALDGRLAGEWIGELTGALHAHTVAGLPVVLDLSGLTFVDLDGATLLRQLTERGASVVGASTFVSTLMAGSGK